MTPIERQARRYLWLFPAWMRADRGEEAVGLVVDLSAPDAEGLAMAARLDLLRAGLHARRRGTPPWRVWSSVMYALPRNRSGTVPDAWRPWLLSRLGQRRFRLERSFVRVVPMATPILAMEWLSFDHAMAFVALGAFVAVGLTLALFSGRWYRDVCRKNGFTADGRPAPAALVAAAEYEPSCPNIAVDVLARWGLLASTVIAVGQAVGSAAPAWRWNGGWTVVVLTAPAAAMARVVVRLPVPRIAGSPRPVEHRSWRWATLSPIAAFIALTAATTLFFTAGYDGQLGASVIPVGAAAAFAVNLALARRHQEQTGRRLGLWEVVPALGPLPAVEWLQEPERQTGAGTPPGLA